MVVLDHTSAVKMLRQEDPELKVSMDNIASRRLVCLKNRDPNKTHTDEKLGQPTQQGRWGQISNAKF